ncbi:Helicase, C-terminal domain and DNA/RNA helicase, DEAD/DEAH box type, N-terminal domain and Helicase, superfamily 1/2, ATP-binding domain and RNA helicase, DEAD-box type, Q motif domain and P-loop containing nucleoside triphosphate hydrolase domain-containing protein [Strongyloides ratti]|uniref:ATP-dependent RNA helicase n=1 Tax=Strongyloides ratti TaxID=34506 RepID=A0A090LGR4_STRRB|nr:Helicase, C-terminal domain and DNA/RNA helicase, DEAD/DEAH box type, N-terminal domain and Helicase, superfamily 1/2, ATP-binding domain and RNA helicase, DEAD-box type, Q motif domain and P-loop containing nucleoside triphosphate hydrolase domain-containing protein [Strongyloides ratti]CEF67308.1 Helicase, C-terminal domain and DNA/RNA helicase, DEAD/DEAH box type, N-terminal domain and Helicase, superfamily 1/2, ATP-binding domain and RNA helicase, DEAD-box type, Q motif domain and P-loop co
MTFHLNVTDKYEDLHLTSDEGEDNGITTNSSKRFSETTNQQNRLTKLFGYKPEIRDPEKLIIQRKEMIAPNGAFEYNSSQTYHVSNEELFEMAESILQKKDYKTFEDLGINKEILKVLHAMNKNDMTVIQHVVASAPTGYGKTYAYIVPIIDYILKKRSHSSSGFNIGRSPLGMMLAVTRDLAKQLMEDVQALTNGTSFRAVLIYGEMLNRDIQNELDKGCDFIIACLGRLKTLTERKVINLDNLRYLVVDEADKFISDPTFKYEMNEFLKDTGINVRKSGKLTRVLTSAVIDEQILDEVTSLFIPDSKYVFIDHSKSRRSWNVKEEFLLVEGYDRFHTLIEILKSIKSKDPNAKIIVFFGSRNEMDLAATWMNLSNVPNKSISGNRTQEMRDNAMKVIDEVPGTILISTDVTERGVDVKGAKYVIHHNVPQKYSKYINRIGRVGRHEGFEGISIMFVTNDIECINDISLLVKDMIKCQYKVPPKLLNLYEENEREKERQKKYQIKILSMNNGINNGDAPAWAEDLNID